MTKKLKYYLCTQYSMYKWHGNKCMHVTYCPLSFRHQRPIHLQQIKGKHSLFLPNMEATLDSISQYTVHFTNRVDHL